MAQWNQVNAKHLRNNLTMLVQRPRRWADAVQILCNCFVFAGNYIVEEYLEPMLGLRRRHWPNIGSMNCYSEFINIILQKSLVTKIFNLLQNDIFFLFTGSML